MSTENGDKVVVWEPGKPVMVKGIRGPTVDKEYARIDGQGPYHLAFVIKDTLRNTQLIDLFNEQYKSLERARSTLLGMAMIAFREEG